MQTVPILNLNSNPSTFKDGEAKDAWNVVLTKDLKAVQNEDGFLSFHTTTGIILGKIEVPDGFVLFSNLPDTITYIKNNNVVKTITSLYLGFNSNNPIDGEYTFNSDNELIVTFSEGVDGRNERRIININSSPSTLTQADIAKLDIIPNVIYPSIYGYSYNGGSILAGTYQIAVAYKVDNEIYSNYSILGVPIHVTGDITNHAKIGDIVDRHLILSLSNLDTRYSKFKIGILYKGLDTFEACYETEDIYTSVNSYKIYNTHSLSQISIDDLTIPSVSYIKDESSTIFAGRLYRVNTKTIDYRELDSVMQNLANNVKVSLIPNPNFANPNITALGITTTYFKEGEHYALYIAGFDYKGNFVNAYPIPCKAGDDTTPVNASTSNSFKVHKVPYLSMGSKVLQTLKCTLPSNIDSYLDSNVNHKFSTIITSFCYLYAKHDFYNSKILGQGFAITDYIVNDFINNQNYGGVFANRSKFRFYPLEHLFLKSRLSNIAISRYKTLDLNASNKYNNTNLRYFAAYGNDNLLQTSNINVNNISYLRNNNTADNNIAGESHYVGEILQANGETIFDTRSNTEYGAAIVEIVSKSEDFYHDLYNQKLVMASSIIPKSSTEDVILQGDFFFSNFTFRITGPATTYVYGGADPNLQGEDYVYKFIISLGVESRFNPSARFDGANYNQKIFNITSPVDLKINDFLNIPYASDNFINTDEGKGYDLNCHYIGYDYNVYERELDTKFIFGNRVIRSVVDSNESRGIPWRIFKANDYKDLVLNRGSLTNIKSDERALYLQQEYCLSVAYVRDKLSNSDEGEAYLGSSDVFDREPIEILYDKTGYIGCNNRFSTSITPFGYVVVDSVKANIFVVKLTNAQKLSNPNVEEWLTNNIKNDVNNPIYNPYKNNGIVLLYDDKFKSLFVTQVTEANSFTLQYNFIHKGWISRHNYIPNDYITTRTSTYCVKGNTVYKRNIGKKGCYFDNVPVESSVTFIYNIESEVYKQILGLMFNTRVTLNDNFVYNKTFDQVLIFNDTQCTGLLDVNKADDWFDTDSGVYVKDDWFVNVINDIVKDDKSPFMNKDGSLITNNLNSESDWFDKSYLISKYCFVRFVCKNIPVGTSYYNVIFNSYSVNAIKSIR